MREITVGVDIGTTSVKAIAADADGNVVARARVPHPIVVPDADGFEHDAGRAWRRGVRRAFRSLEMHEARGISVSAMVPSLAAVNRRGVPVTPGLLYGDARGRGDTAESAMGSGEFVAFLGWLARECPDAFGYWPAQTVANYALARQPVLDTTTAVTALPLFNWVGWEPELMHSLGVRESQLPRLVPTGAAAGRLPDDGPVLASGCVDAFAEQLVAGADNDGDVLVMCGTTMIVWVVVPETATVNAPGYFQVPHTARGKLLIGGPSNAGGLFLNWATRALAGGTAASPERVPVWAPYPRGERVPIHDAQRRALLADLDLTHDAAAIRRAAFEAAGFVVRRTVEATHTHPRRIVATGGGVRVPEWMQALADCTGLPVDPAAVPEGAALGSAYLARMAAGLETDMLDARRWARSAPRVDPDAAWVDAGKARYERFVEIADHGEVKQ